MAAGRRASNRWWEAPGYHPMPPASPSSYRRDGATDLGRHVRAAEEVNREFEHRDLPGRTADAVLPIRPLTFWLTTHEHRWLSRTNAPLLVTRERFYEREKSSRRRGQLLATLPRALGPWALDSGGFTEVTGHGDWRVATRRYVADVRALRDQVGNLCWASPMDWMVEEQATRKTGWDVRTHQTLTIYNALELRMLAPDVPFIPVLQGWTVDDYMRHVEDYYLAGIDLAKEPLVGVGTMCRRDACGADIAAVLRRILRARVRRLHAFGVKSEALAEFREPLGDLIDRGYVRAGMLPPIVSADSAAWSRGARENAARGRGPMIRGHVHGKTNSCANCYEWAMLWRSRVIAAAGMKDPAWVCTTPPCAPHAPDRLDPLGRRPRPPPRRQLALSGVGPSAGGAKRHGRRL